ncbi:hypothetical protein ACUXHY_001928 [Cytobacillus horneckiae]|uniref:hypothetical protein n=1 Tax=Cytobacillus horneckiae TaxID=549687 RepID=UPI0019D30DAA|nr:hypothetical protein [Cytobacillus horneckiae]
MENASFSMAAFFLWMDVASRINYQAKKDYDLAETTSLYKPSSVEAVRRTNHLGSER